MPLEEARAAPLCTAGRSPLASRTLQAKLIGSSGSALTLQWTRVSLPSLDWDDQMRSQRGESFFVVVVVDRKKKEVGKWKDGVKEGSRERPREREKNKGRERRGVQMGKFSTETKNV